MKRMWVNQPSTTQAYHKWHGQNVLVCPEPNSKRLSRVYFLSGPIVSVPMVTSVLSEGWKEPA